MARPESITLTKMQQKKALSSASKGMGARRIASDLGVSRYQVMALLEEHSMASFSEGSYD